jgi:Asp-tRNA(Asn)/Glu-tRNA(Gln) amidotransferase B subunit
MVSSGEITGRIAKEILPPLLQTWQVHTMSIIPLIEALSEHEQGTVKEYIEVHDMRAIRDVPAVENFMREVMKANVDKVTSSLCICMFTNNALRCLNTAEEKPN